MTGIVTSHNLLEHNGAKVEGGESSSGKCVFFMIDVFLMVDAVYFLALSESKHVLRKGKYNFL